MKRTLTILALVALAACGKKTSLRELDGVALPPKPATAAVQPTPDQLLATDTQQRPTRFNELVTKSQELQADRFNMPPPG